MKNTTVAIIPVLFVHTVFAVSPLFPNSGFLYSCGDGNVTARTDVVVSSSSISAESISTNGIQTSKGVARRTVYADLTVSDESAVPYSVVTNEIQSLIELPRTLSVDVYGWISGGSVHQPFDPSLFLGSATCTLQSQVPPYRYVNSGDDYLLSYIEYKGSNTWEAVDEYFQSEYPANDNSTNVSVQTAREVGFDALSSWGSGSTTYGFCYRVSPGDLSSGVMVPSGEIGTIQITTNGFETVTNSIPFRSDLYGFVPKTTRINGTPLESDITIQGMTDEAVVLTNGTLRTYGGSVMPETLSSHGITNAYTKAEADASFRSRTDNVCHADSYEMITVGVPSGITFNTNRFPSWNSMVSAWDWYDDNGVLWYDTDSSPSAVNLVFHGQGGTPYSIYTFTASKVKVSTSDQSFVTFDNIMTPQIATNIAASAAVTNAGTKAYADATFSRLTTNDVCNIVTNDVVHVPERWAFPQRIEGVVYPGTPFQVAYTGELVSVSAIRLVDAGFWHVEVTYDAKRNGEMVTSLGYTQPMFGSTSCSVTLDAIDASVMIDGTYVPSATYTGTNALGLAYRRDVPTTNGLVTAQGATNIAYYVTTDIVDDIKAKFYDHPLQVEWTVRMVNGDMKLYATTNVDTSVFNN